MIVHTHVLKTKATPMPSQINRVPGNSLAARKHALVNQLAAVDGLLACTRDTRARANLNSTRNMITEAIAFIDAQQLRANPSYK
jgi:hypothetical protein